MRRHDPTYVAHSVPIAAQTGQPPQNFPVTILIVGVAVAAGIITMYGVSRYRKSRLGVLGRASAEAQTKATPG